VIAYPDFANCTVLVIGDVMLDRYFWGDVTHISPEAPVPVVRVNKARIRHFKISSLKTYTGHLLFMKLLRAKIR